MLLTCLYLTLIWLIFQISSNPCVCVCGYALCENCLHNENRLIHDSKECSILKALSKGHSVNLIEASEENGQLPNCVYEPIAPIRLLMKKWWVYLLHPLETNSIPKNGKFFFRNDEKAFEYVTTLMDHDLDRKQDNNGEYWKHRYIVHEVLVTLPISKLIFFMIVISKVPLSI